ncbi:hypothetical protein CR513_44298, partial [Mucuna pruriens]
MKGLKKFWLPQFQILVSNVLVDKVLLHTIIDKVLYVESRKYNPFSIRQFCDNDDNTIFFFAIRNNNLYKINLEDINKQNAICVLVLNLILLGPSIYQCMGQDPFFRTMVNECHVVNKLPIFKGQTYDY